MKIFIFSLFVIIVLFCYMYWLFQQSKIIDNDLMGKPKSYDYATIAIFCIVLANMYYYRDYIKEFELLL